MDSRVVQSEVHENDENYPNNVASQQDDHQLDHEKKSVMIMNKVKAKAKKIKDTIKKHGHQVLDRGHENNNQDHHTLDDHDHDLNEDEEMAEDPEVHATPIHESEFVKTASPTTEQVQNLEKSGINSGGPKVVGEKCDHDPLVEGVSSTTEIDQSLATDPAKTFSVEEKEGPPKENLERTIGLKEDAHTPESRPEPYTPPNYQTKVIDPFVAGSDETETTPVEESFARLNVKNEPKPTAEPKIHATVADSKYSTAGSHDQFMPQFSEATQTQYPSAASHDQLYEGSRPDAYNSPNFQTKPSDPRGPGSDEIEITPVEESFARMDVHDEPKPTLEPNVQPTVTDSEYTSAKSLDQFVPHFSAETQTQYPSAEIHDQFSQEKVSTNINRNPENPTETEQSFNTNTTTIEEQPNYEANTDKVVSPRTVTSSGIGSGEKSDINDKVTTNEEQQESENASHKSGSTAEYGKNIAQSLTQKLAPVYDKVAGVGSAVKSKVSGTNSGGGVETETKDEAKEQGKGVSVKDYLAEKLRPGEEDKALSEVISEALHKGKEEPVKNEHEKSEKVSEESIVNSPGKGVVDKLKGVVGSWFGKSEENQSSKVAGNEDLSKNANYVAEVEQVRQVVDENKTTPIEEQGTR